MNGLMAGLLLFKDITEPVSMDLLGKGSLGR